MPSLFRRFIILLAPIAIAPIAPSLVVAQDTTARRDTIAKRDTSARALGTVVISATRSTTTANNVPLHVTTLGQAQIQQSPANTLDQVLRNVSGMNISGAPYYTTDPTGQQTRMRGVTNSTVLMLVDGVPIHDPFYSTTQWFKVPLSSIYRVEVLRGGASSLWGNLAVAGVVNIITKKPVDNDAQLDLHYESQNTLNASAAKDVVLTNGLSLRFFANGMRTDGYQTTPDAYLGTVPGKGPSSATNSNAQVAAYFTPDASWNGFIRAGYHEQNEDIGGYAYGHNVQKSPDAAAGFTKDFSSTVHADVRAWSQYESFDKGNGAACYLASATSCNTSAVTSPLVQYPNSLDDNPYREFGASAILSSLDIAGPQSSLQVGADFRSVSGSDNATTYNHPTTIEGSSASINRTNFGKGLQQFAGLFTQLSVAPVPRVQATLSLRYDTWQNEDGVAEITKYANGVPGQTNGGSIANSSQNSFNPSISARVQATDALSFRGAAYRAFRAPGLNNLYRSYSSTTFISIANPLLKPETLTGGEVGADWRGDMFTLGATWFQYNTKALIATYKVTSAATAPAAVTAVCGADLSNCPATITFNTNDQDAVSRGLELTGHWQPIGTVGVDAGYTYTDSHYTSSTTGDPIDVQLGAIPTSFATLAANWQVTPSWNASADAHYNSSMYLDVNQTIPQSAFTVFGANVSYQFTSTAQVYASVANITNKRYADNATTSASSEILGMPRTIGTGVRLHF
jgi:iron complex outermembrane receptor protein